MAIVVRSNAQSVFAQVRLNRTSNALGRTFEALSTGSRINRAADDAAGLAISTLLEHRIKGQQAAKQNAQEGISMIQTAEGGVEQVRSMLDRMRELAVRSANETPVRTERTLTLSSSSSRMKSVVLVRRRRITATTCWNRRSNSRFRLGLIIRQKIELA